MYENLAKVIEQRKKAIESKNIFRETEEQRQFISIAKGLPFYLWHHMLNNTEDQHNQIARETGGMCCFNHLISLPKKDNVSHNLYPYEYQLYRDLMRPKPKPTDPIELRQTYKKHWILKSTGLGITEILLRWICWMCVRNDELKGHKVLLVTGPNLQLAQTLIKRIKELFLGPDSRHQILFEGSQTEIVINSVYIKAVPSHHMDAMRGLTDVSIILLDEADFFPESQSNDVRDVSERYIAKSAPWIILVSTPNRPQGFMDSIGAQPLEECIYKKLYFPYTVGLNKIYSASDIADAKRSMSFEREYNLKFLGNVGNVFLPDKIDAAITRGKTINIYQTIMNNARLRIETQFYIGVDPSWGSSKFAICLIAAIDNLVYVLETIELHRVEFNVCIETAISLLAKYEISISNICYLVDASSPSVIMSLKQELNEDPNYLQLIEYRKKNKVRDVYHDFKVIPVNFNTENKKNMLLNIKQLTDMEMVVLDSNRHNNLITALRSAQANDMILDKQATSNDDSLDAFCLACRRLSVTK